MTSMWSNFFSLLVRLFTEHWTLAGVFCFVVFAVVLSAFCCMWSPCREEDPCFKHDTI